MKPLSVPLQYTIIVLGPPYGTQQSSLAYQFTVQLVKMSHVVKCVFFYGEGVLNANCYVSFANDEFDLSAGWRELTNKFDVPLAFCLSAGLRRGIDDNHNVVSHFKPGSLALFSEVVADSDRIIQF